MANTLIMTLKTGTVKIELRPDLAPNHVARIKELVSSALAKAPRAVTYGVMIETPAAVELTRDLAREVDFFSIGTNDLVQYTLVVDREDPRLSSARHAYHPAILRMIRRVATQAHDSGKHVTVCGEMAARPELAVVKVGSSSLQAPGSRLTRTRSVASWPGRAKVAPTKEAPAGKWP